MATKSVVVASINYCLGPFGYLALPQLDHGKHKSGNFGLQDIIAALKWVHTHIDELVAIQTILLCGANLAVRMQLGCL
jgi:carboxylesterase type B